MAACKRNELSLKKKVEVVKYTKKNPNVGSRKLASLFECGKTQIQTILRKQEAIMNDFEANGDGGRKIFRSTDNEDINEAVYKWYCLARQRNIPISGPLLQEEALQIAKTIDPETKFKASNGWLESFKKRHNLKQITISGECGDVQEETVAGWMERLKFLLRGYKPEDVWNTDETGCFYRALPDKSLAEVKKGYRGGKKAKERLTICFFVNAAGGRELPIVIGRSANPRCFKGLRNKSNPHGLPYYSNSKAWMNTDIMTTTITKLNAKMKREGRKIILLMDNVSSHSRHLLFSNVKVVFLPVNTTSRLQPLDAGIIKNFKVHYRRQLLKHVLTKVNDERAGGSASSVCKSVNVLLAIKWIKLAWEEVSPDTIRNCFRHCGAIPDVEHQIERELSDPFADLDADSDMHTLQTLYLRWIVA